MQVPTEESCILEVMSVESGIPYKELTNVALTKCGAINDPTDRGGKTSIWGWTQASIKACGSNCSAEQLTFKEAYELYAKHFYVKSGASLVMPVHPYLAKAMLNYGIHSGYKQAAMLLQRLLNMHNNDQAMYKDIVVDGSIGAQTINTLMTYLQKRKGDGDDILFTDYMIAIGAFYQQIIRNDLSQEKYMMGWSRRVHEQLRDYFLQK